MKELAKSRWAWTLYETSEGDFLLEVTCGTVGIFEVKYPLSLAERERYLLGGAEVLDQIAARVRTRPNDFLPPRS